MQFPYGLFLLFYIAPDKRDICILFFLFLRKKMLCVLIRSAFLIFLWRKKKYISNYWLKKSPTLYGAMFYISILRPPRQQDHSGSTKGGLNSRILLYSCLCNFDPLKPHFYMVKLGFTGVYIIFPISAQKHRLWILVRTAFLRRF